jgi:hypothetical protein
MIAHSTRKPKNKKNNLSEGETPNLADVTEMELEEPCFELSVQAPVDVFSLYEHQDKLSFEPPMIKKFSYQYNVGEHDIVYELD